MKYPENERILIVRPCLKAVCLGVRSASKLLSVLLYRARNCKEEETTFAFTCTQVDLVNDLCEELTTKQLHDMAIPVLQLLGYLDVDGSGFRHTYTVHLDKVQEALSCYRNKEKLELLLISFIYQQLEEVPMELELVPIQLEEVLKHLELLLKTIGKSSNSKRGRKPRPQAALAGNSENVDSNRDITDSITDKKRTKGAFALPSFSPSEDDDFSEEDDPAPTEHRIPAIKLNGANQNEHPMEPPAIRASSQSLHGSNSTDSTAGHARVYQEDHSTETYASKQTTLTAVVAGSEPRPSPESARNEPPEKPVQQASSAAAEASSVHKTRTVAQSKRKSKAKAAPVVEELPIEVAQFLDDWDSLHRAPLPRTPRLIALAEAAIKAKITPEELKGCRNWLPTTDRPGKPYYRLKGVGLWDILDKIGEYRSLQNMPIPGVPIVDKPPDDPNITPPEVYKTISGMLAYQKRMRAMQEGTVTHD